MMGERNIGVVVLVLNNGAPKKTEETDCHVESGNDGHARPASSQHQRRLEEGRGCSSYHEELVIGISTISRF